MDAPPPEFDSAIAAYYDRATEEDRLEQGPFLLEALRTKELIQRYAPAAPATVIDIGGAAGAYALWLADAGQSIWSIRCHVLLPKRGGGARTVGARSRPAKSATRGERVFRMQQPTSFSSWGRSTI